MADLFTPEELRTYGHRDYPEATAVLYRELVEDALRGHPEYGHRITDPPQRGIKGLALEVARRALTNPGNAQTESANGTSVTYFPGAGRGVDLTDREVAKLRELVGDSTAYTVPLADDGLGRSVDWPPAGYDPYPPRRAGW